MIKKGLAAPVQDIEPAVTAVSAVPGHDTCVRKRLELASNVMVRLLNT